jgi:hypothetical protein
MNQTIQQMNINYIYRDNNTANTLKRFAREVTPMQHFRELFINAKESGATKIMVTADQVIQEDLGVKRLTVKDNGKGMNPDEMLKYLCSHNSSSKSHTSGVHENFGIGAKATCLTWNKYGLVYISYTKENPEGSMIWLAYDEIENRYGAVSIPVFNTEDGIILTDDDGEPDECSEPVVNLQDLKLRYEDEGGYHGVRWWEIKPSKKNKTGTIVICCGDSKEDNTYCHDSKGDPITGRSIHWYFIKRFSYLNGLLQVSREGIEFHNDTVKGLRELLNKKHIVKETVAFDKGWSIDVYSSKVPFFKTRQHFNLNELNSGMILVEYKQEFYHVKTSIKSLKSWGINQKDVAKKTVLIIRPPVYHEKEDGTFYGAFPNERRDALYFESQRSSDRDKLIDVDWLKPLFDANKPEHLEALLQESFSKKVSQMSSNVEDALKKVGGIFKTLKRKRERIDKIKACEGGALEFAGDDSSLARGVESSPNAQPEKEGNQENDGSSNGSNDKPNDPMVGSLKGKIKGKKTKVKDTTCLVKTTWKTHSDNDELEIEDHHNFPFDYSHSRTTGELFANKDSELFREIAAYHADLYVNGQGDAEFKGILNIVKDVYLIKCVTMILHFREHCRQKKLIIGDLTKPIALYQQCLGVFNESDQIEKEIKRKLTKLKKKAKR